MLTVLTLEEKIGKNAPARVLNRLRGDSLGVDIREYKGIALKELVYKQRRKNINLRRISIAAGVQRNGIICPEGIFKNGEAGLYRFYSVRFKQRLCTNFALQTVRAMKNTNRSLSIGILDRGCVCGDIMRDILAVFDRVKVVSPSAGEYEYIAEEIFADCGASFLLTENCGALNSCDFIIAPEQINFPLKPSAHSIVLTIAPPSAGASGEIYYDYEVELPAEYESLRPAWCSGEYFGSALYAKGRQYQLGSLIPRLCSNNTVAQTVRSMAKRLCSARQNGGDF